MGLRFQRLHRKLRVIGSLAFNIIQFFAALIAIVTTTTGAALIAWFFHSNGFVIPLITFMLGLFVAFLLVIILLLKSSPARWVLGGYKYVRTDCLYVIHEDDLKHHTFTVEIEIEAIKSGVSILEDTYRWTGQGQEGEPKVVSPGHTLMGKIIKQNGWRYFYIHLGQELKTGGRTVVKTVQELYDSTNEFEPFLSKVVSLPIDHMILHVILPKNLSPINIFFREWSTEGPASRVIREFTGKMNTHSREIRWEIQSPVFGHRYSIDWNYQ